jgi:predicted MFS family arabinose efflux permease
MEIFGIDIGLIRVSVAFLVGGVFGLVGGLVSSKLSDREYRWKSLIQRLILPFFITISIPVSTGRLTDQVRRLE